MGKNAKATLATAPNATIYHFRSLLGRKFDHADVQTLKSQVTYSIMKTSDGEPAVQLTVSKQKIAFSPQQLSTMVFQRLKATAEAVLSRRVRAVTVTVPASFDDAQRAALTEAIRASGFSTIELIVDGVAAARAPPTVSAAERAAYGATLAANPTYNVADHQQHDEL